MFSVQFLAEPASPQASLLLPCPVRSLMASRSSPEAHCAWGLVPGRETNLGILGGENIYICFPAEFSSRKTRAWLPYRPSSAPSLLPLQKCQAAPTCRPSREWQLQSFAVAQQWQWQENGAPGAGPSASFPKPCVRPRLALGTAAGTEHPVVSRHHCACCHN